MCKDELTSTSAGVVPFTSPDTCTTFPSLTLLAPLMFKPPVFDPSALIASFKAFCAIPKLGFGAGADEEEERRSESERLPSNRSCDHAALTSPLGVRLSRPCSRF